jgi:DNA uptake protein ComE-like DNA-binding protein
LNAEEWQQLGFSEKQANVIVNYRDKNLKGSFRSLEDIQNCFVISEENLEK